MDKTVGILGGGQLGLMLTEAANTLNVKVVTLDREDCPVIKMIKTPRPKHVTGSFTDPNAIRHLATLCDILTIEIEHVNTDVLEDLSKSTNIDDKPKKPRVEVQPSWMTIRTIQDKYRQKVHLLRNRIPVADSRPIEESNIRNVEDVGKDLGYPFMLKSRTEAYDGKGNYPVKSSSDIPAALKRLKDRPLYAERWASFTKELAVMVVKVEDEAIDSLDSSGRWEKTTVAYPVVETIHEESICKLVYAPARNVSGVVMQKAQILARQAVAGFWGKGVFGVEMFLLDDRSLLINEIAPRPHNSGHYTIEACRVSQYEAHLKSILGLPISEEDTRLKSESPFAVMLNILGGTLPNLHDQAAEAAKSISGAHIHMYGKGDSRPGRKMGHVTILASSMNEAEERVSPLVRLLDHSREVPKQVDSSV